MNFPFEVEAPLSMLKLDFVGISWRKRENRERQAYNKFTIYDRDYDPIYDLFLFKCK